MIQQLSGNTLHLSFAGAWAQRCRWRAAQKLLERDISGSRRAKEGLTRLSGANAQAGRYTESWLRVIDIYAQLLRWLEASGREREFVAPG